MSYLKIGSVCLLIIIIALIGMSQCSSSKWPEFDDWEPQPYVEEPVANEEPETVTIADPIISGNSRLDKLIKRLGTPPYPDVYSNSGDILVGMSAKDGLTIVEHVLHSSIADDFLGRFDREFFYPGSIVGCMPLVRADLRGREKTLSSLQRKPYRIVMEAFTSSDPTKTRVRGDWTIEAGVQNQQGAQFRQILNDIYANADDYISPTRYRRSSRYARSYQEAQAKLGLSLKTPLVSGTFDGSQARRSDRRVFLGMIQQEFYRIGIAQDDESVLPGPRAYIPENDNTVRVISSMLSDKPGAFDIPAIISQVRYGRIILVAFETSWSKSDDEKSLSINGKWNSGSGSMSAFDKEINRAASGTIDIIVYGGGDLPQADLDGIQTTTEKDGSTSYMVDKNEVVDLLNKLLATGPRWSGLQPGVPIGVSLQLLDDANTALPQFNNSLASLARSLTPASSWRIELNANIGNDFDGGVFGGSGEWDFKWTQDGNHLTSWSRDVGAPTSFTDTYSSAVPATWGQRFTGFSVDITEKDDMFRGSDDHSRCDIQGDLTLAEPNQYKVFSQKNRELSDAIADLTSAFEKTKRLEGASSDTDSAQIVTHTAYVESLQILRDRFRTANQLVSDLKPLVDAAEKELARIENNGVEAIKGSADGNTYTVTAKPDLYAYRRYMKDCLARGSETVRNIKRYLNAP